MTAKEAREIARFHRKMFQLHDEESWEEFRENVEKYLITLGYGEQQSKSASKHVMNAYKFADKAALAQDEGSREREDEMYKKAMEEHIMAHTIIGTEIESVKYKVGWYKAARHKNHLGVLFNVFMEHFTRFGWSKLILALKCTYITMFKAYRAHNLHAWEKLEKIFFEYYSTIIDYHKDASKLPVEL